MIGSVNVAIYDDGGLLDRTYNRWFQLIYVGVQFIIEISIPLKSF